MMPFDLLNLMTQMLQLSIQAMVAMVVFCTAWVVLIEVSRDW